jgi:hypothetical protein
MLPPLPASNTGSRRKPSIEVKFSPASSLNSSSNWDKGIRTRISCANIANYVMHGFLHGRCWWSYAPSHRAQVAGVPLCRGCSRSWTHRRPAPRPAPVHPFALCSCRGEGAGGSMCAAAPAQRRTAHWCVPQNPSWSPSPNVWRPYGQAAVAIGDATRRGCRCHCHCHRHQWTSTRAAH